MTKFTHLHVHSEYSLLDGLSKIDKLLARAKEMKMDSLALTDHGVLYGAIKFYLQAQELEIKPIIGMEAYMASRSRFDKQAKAGSDQHHLILLAKNEKGYQNLMKLATLAHLEGFYYKPRIDMEILKENAEGLIACTACIKGEIPDLLRRGKEKQAENKAKEFQEVFGNDFYLEIQRHQHVEDQDQVNDGLVKLSRKLGIPLIAANDVHYVAAEDAEAQDALLAIQTQKMIADKDRLTMIESPDYYLKSSEEMKKLFADFPDALENTRKIARSCNLEIPIGNWILPHYPLPENESAEAHLKKLAHKKLTDRFQAPSQEVIERLDYELDVICKKGFATYFLIVQDFVTWAKRRGIRVGPGRGSVAGSLASYVLKITSINPLEHNLPFERFMNPQRPTPPDIDLDFADDKRDEVIAYVTEKYGQDRVAQIITFGTMEARGSVRDIGRVLGMPYSEPDKIAKLIPFGMSIAQALKSVPELATAYRQPKYKKLLDLAQKVEGVARHASTHAAGVVIADKELIHYTPLQKESKGDRIITQYDMYSLDLNVSEKAIGLLKMDFLGLRTLTILQKTLEYVKQLRGEEIDLSEVALDDAKAYRMIASGETTGLFQLESSGMRRVARKLKPNRFSDIAAMVALFRPGPMQWIDEFIAGKENPNRVHYPHPDLKPILEETYGIAVYQEQCLQIANVMGGYSLGEADILRRAIGKKKKAIMTREKNKFVKHAQEAGYKKEIAEKVFALIERFAGYGFNKAHSTSYAMIAYQTAYLKANFPVEFMTALLTAESHNADKIALAVEECRRLNIIVLAPDINQSKVGFTIEDKKESYDGKAIRFGLSAIKNVGDTAIEVILAARDVGGDFKSLTDFCQRVDAQKVNKKVLESLIKAGAMDAFGKRAAMLSGLDKIRIKGALAQKQRIEGQTSLFENSGSKNPGLDTEDDLPAMEEFNRNELLSLEKDLLGFYLTEHPLTAVLSLLSQERSHKLRELSLSEYPKGRVKVGGLVNSLRIVLTKGAGREMAFATIEDDTGSLEAVVFPNVFQATRRCWLKDQIILVEGKVEVREENLSLIVETASLLGEGDFPKGDEKKEGIVDFEIRIPARISPKKLVELNRLLKQNQGNNRLALVFVDGLGRERKMALPFGVKYNQKLAGIIKKLIES